MTPQNTFYFNLSTADHIGIGFFKYSLSNKRFIIVNNALASIFGYEHKKDIKEQDFLSLFVKKEDAHSFLNTVKKEESTRGFEVQLHKKGKKTFYASITTVHVRSQKSEYIEGIIEDVTARHEMEEKLARERNFMQSLLDNIPDAVYFKDEKNRIVKVNSFYAQGVGLTPEQAIGKTDFDFFPKEQAEKFIEDDNYVLRTGKPIIGKVEKTVLPNGDWNQVITTKIAMYDKDGKIIGTMGITRDMTEYAQSEQGRLEMVKNGLSILVKALEMRDPYTFSHTRYVANIVECIGKKLGWDDNRILGMRLAAELHDLGKINIPLDILNKPGKLSDLEYRFIQEHVKHCYDLIKDIEFPFSLAETIYQHHERIDGSGYPQKLKGEQILPEARVLAVSDVLEAMTNHRPYRAGLGVEMAKEELANGAGIKYDKKVVDLVFDLFEKNNQEPFWMHD